ncbi:MAG: HK97 gp10 family phage protein [Kiloniellales bacterium]
MSVRVTVSGAGRFAARLDRLADQVAWAVQAAVEEGAQDLRREARDILSIAGRGEASAPGEPPRRQTGALRDSLTVALAPDRLSARVGTDLDSGADLEFGTQAMAPRPWLAPAAENVAPKIQARIEAAVREAIRRAARR